MRQPVAVQCLSSSWGVDGTHGVASRFGTSLPAVFDGGMKQLATESAPAAAAAAAADAPLPTAAEKEQAEAAKVQGNNKLKEKDYNGAVESYTRAIQLDARNALYYANRAAAYSSLLMWEEAIRDCDQSIALDPTYSKAHSRKGCDDVAICCSLFSHSFSFI